MNEKTKSAVKLVAAEFAVLFAAEVGGNLILKTGQGVIVSAVIALVTAVVLFIFQTR